MKPYDFLFFIVLIIIMLFRKRYHLLVVAGMLSLVLSLVNYALLVSMRPPSEALSSIGVGPLKISFETAQHLTWYAGAFFLSSILIWLLQGLRERK